LAKKKMALMTENHLSKSQEPSWFDEWKLATFKDGFIIGVFSALVLQLGIINVTTVLQKSIVFAFLLFGIFTSINQALRRKALISPPWDGFLSGFGTLIGIIDLLFLYLSIL